MSATPPLPRLFGPYVLTRALGADPLGHTYRAGTATGRQLRPFLLVRVYDGEAVDRAVLLPAMETAVEYLEEVKGPAVAKGMVLGIVDDQPFAGMEYVPGRTLDQVIGADAAGHAVPVPVEHALLIAEKILAALEAAKPMARGTGAPHGFLVPGFVAVSNDGDTRVFGAGLGPGLLPSLKDARAAAAFGAYIAPEVAAGGKPSPAGDLYSMGVILLETLTGKRPAAGAAADALEGAVLAVNGNPLPEDIKRLLARVLSKEPARRDTDVSAFRKDLGKLLYGGPYAPSTFNLAFFMHQQFEKAVEAERREMNAEEQLDVRTLQQAEDAAHQPAPAARAAAAPPRDVTVPSFGVRSEHTATDHGAPSKKMGGLPVGLVAAGVVLLAAIGVWATKGMWSRPAATPTPAPVATLAPTVPAATPTPVLVGKEDPEFQAALQAKLQEEEKKLQERMLKEQETAAKKRQAELDRAAEEARKANEAEEAARAARERADQQEAARLAREAAEARQREEAARQAAAAAIPKTNEGDLVDVSQVDTPPSARKIVKPVPSSLALQRHVSGTVLMRVLVDHNGKPEKIETLRDTTPKVGLAEACRNALTGWEWAPALKDGKRVRTWIVVPIPFKGL